MGLAFETWVLRTQLHPYSPGPTQIRVTPLPSPLHKRHLDRKRRTCRRSGETPVFRPCRCLFSVAPQQPPGFPILRAPDRPTGGEPRPSKRPPSTRPPSPLPITNVI